MCVQHQYDLTAFEDGYTKLIIRNVSVPPENLVNITVV